MKKLLSVGIVFLFVTIACKAQVLPDNIDISTSANGIVALPNTVPATFASNGFVKYTKIQCPNGEAIHFIAQNLISDAQILYAKAILEFYLTDFAGSQYGANKTGVKNTMGTNNAMLMLVNGTHIEGQEPNINAQGLYQNEVTVPGHLWYQTNDYNNHRDAAFEEILHLMHDMGIGVDGTNSISNGALPAYQTEIRAAQNNAILNNYAIWPKGAVNDPSWYNDLAQENSLSQEYLASLIDSYYGLWAAWTEDPNTGMWGEYISHTRAEIQTEDPMGWALVPNYFSPFVTIDMIIDPSFNGVFSIKFNAANPYTHKSQYLQHCYLDGANNAGLQGNNEYNRLKGNAGNNSFEGLKGHDRLDGNAGTDTAIFTGSYADYTVSNLTTSATVADGIANRDAVDTLWNMEYMRFSDQTVAITLQTTGLHAIKKEASFNIYPNPSNGSVTIVQEEERAISIFNSLGVLVTFIENPTKQLTLDLSTQKAGLYFIKASNNLVKKLIIN
jgi:hypothetical protein